MISLSGWAASSRAMISPARTRISLLASAIRFPRPDRGDDRFEPGGPDDRAEHNVGFRRSDQFEHFLHAARRPAARRKPPGELLFPGRIRRDLSTPDGTVPPGLRVPQDCSGRPARPRETVPGAQPVPNARSFRWSLSLRVPPPLCSSYRDSTMIVTGPSFTRESFMSAPNRPVATRTPYPRHSSTNVS